MVKENNKKMFMKKLAFFVLIFILIGCNARKSHTKIEEKKVDSLVVAKKETTAKINTQKETFDFSKSNESSLKLNIKPKDGCGFTDFKFTDGNKVYEGKTNGEISTETTQKSTETKKITKYIEKITYKSETTYVTHTTYKSYIKNKQTEKKGTPLHIQILLYLCFFVISVILWEMFKRNYLYLFQIVKKFLKNIG